MPCEQVQLLYMFPQKSLASLRLNSGGTGVGGGIENKESAEQSDV